LEIYMKVTVGEMYRLVAAPNSVLERIRREPLPAKLSRELFYFFAAIMDAYWICDQIRQDLEKEGESTDDLFRKVIEVDVRLIDSSHLDGATLEIEVWAELYRFFDDYQSRRLKNVGSSPLNFRKSHVLDHPMYAENKFTPSMIASADIHEVSFPNEWAKALLLPRGDLANPGEPYDTCSGASGMMGQSREVLPGRGPQYENEGAK
jgi:hypothetical protein